MRRRIRYQSRAAAWCMAAFSSFVSGAVLAGDMPAPTGSIVEAAAPYELADPGMFAPPQPSISLVQPVEFNPVIAPIGDRLVLADADAELMPPPLPITSMPRMTPNGYELESPQYDIQYRFVQQPTDTSGAQDFRGGPQFGESAEDRFGGGGGGLTQTTEDNTPTLVNDISAPTIAIQAPVDTGQLVSTVSTVATQRRSPVSFDPHIRGYRWGQIYVNANAQWAPIRPDLDSALSKIDPSLIQDVVVIPGPYGLRYGPGLAFMDIVLVDTPRYYNGPESHARVGINYRGNGDQTTGRVAAYGGGADYGYLFNYTVKTGIDYQAGDGSYIPSSFNSQNFYGQIGFDLSSDSNIEIRYLHQDQNNTEYAAQFFDLDYLGTDAVTISYVNENFGNASKLSADLWYNYSRYDGNTDGRGKRSPFPVIDRVDRGLTIEQTDYDPTGDPDFAGAPGGTMFNFGTYNPATSDAVLFRGTTAGDQQVAGGRSVLTFGDEGYTQLDVGVDFRYRLQNIQERFNFSFFDVESGQTFAINDPESLTVLGPFSTNLPRSNSANPGVFLAAEMPFSEYWTTQAGARLDYVYTTAYQGGLFGRRTMPDFINLPPDDPANINNNDSSLPVPPGSDLERSDFLYSFFLNNQVDLTEEWTGTIGFGHAQRAPTLLDRYADGVFLGIFQSGFSRVIGNPNVQEEKAWQIDLGLKYDGYNFRGRVNMYHAWILDYITYSVNNVPNLAGANLYQTLNTKYATLGGFEAYGEYDLSTSLQLFGTMAFVEGRDQQINQPLAGISPFEATTGVRLYDRGGGDTWGLEMGVRMVHEQERLGAFRVTGDPTQISIIEQRTPGFTTLYVRGYYNVTDNLHFVGGVENLGDRLYQEHLDLRLPADNAAANPGGINYGQTNVWAPGITPYIGVESTY